MKKSVYSLVLMDDVVEEIDRIAGNMNVSRSGLINSILAEYISFVTPEQHMRNIFNELERMIDAADNLQLIKQSSECIRTLKSSLSYRYRPAIRYQVGLYRSAAPVKGLIKAAFRTQNSELLTALGHFFRTWATLEQTYSLPGPGCKIEPGRYLRELTLKETCKGELDAAQAILDYIEAFDNALKRYFQALGSDMDAEAEVESAYKAHRMNRRFNI